MITFSNIIFSYFVFQHNFGGGVPIEMGSDGYFDFSTSLTNLIGFFAFINGLLFLLMSALFFFISRKSSKPTFRMRFFALLLSCSACALVNYTGVYDGLYESGHIFRMAYDEYSLRSMYVFSWIFTCVAMVLAILLFYFFKFIRMLVRGLMSLFGILRPNKDTIK
jgi:hypothetical protein